MNTTGIILAGGKSSRMGEDKGLISFRGKLMIEHVINVLEQFSIPIIIIANNDDYNQFGYPVYSDIISDRGPAGGIFTGLTHTKTETNIIVSCDSPLITSQLIENLLEAHDGHQITMPRFKDKTHPLIGIYERNSLETFKSNIEKEELKLRVINSTLNTFELEFNEESIINNKDCFSNINTKDELKQLEV